MRLCGGLGILVGEQVGVRLVVRAADPATQLVELREAELVGARDDDGIGVRIVDAGFDNCRTEQQVVFLLGEFTHDAFELALGQLAMADHDARFRQEILQPVAHILDGVDFVM